MKRAFLFFVAALVSCAWSCSGDDSSGFETGPGDGSDSSILNDVTFQPFDAPPTD
jgi:hypothetical protein